MRHTLRPGRPEPPGYCPGPGSSLIASGAGRAAGRLADSLWLLVACRLPPALPATRALLPAATRRCTHRPHAGGRRGQRLGRNARRPVMIKQIVRPACFSDATILAVVNTVHVKAGL